ncbi:hypothetical protein DEU56DRAFT_955875 [Suillus clintonianus]|uniref:uncharacterized protein n=1 Tax=Suillus clintonianus TaxID=1904413 RepID=UPI001B85CDEF|nr:uncharacterized protein DEU56DRAFT_955875 [Suillus clintonianus]KAG2130211.1 hypothetical protein DEU56DRAFT_955875 [Suillus clintonianus]
MSVVGSKRTYLLSSTRGEVEKSPYEGAHLLSMVEEVFYVLITIVGERASTTRLPFQRAIHREIMHALAAGLTCPQGLYLTSAHLSQTSDTGVYELKDEAYDEVDPFTFHYTWNKCEEVEVILKNRLRVAKWQLPTNPVVTCFVVQGVKFCHDL